MNDTCSEALLSITHAFGHSGTICRAPTIPSQEPGKEVGRHQRTTQGSTYVGSGFSYSFGASSPLALAEPGAENEE